MDENRSPLWSQMVWLVGAVTSSAIASALVLVRTAFRSNQHTSISDVSVLIAGWINAV